MSEITRKNVRRRETPMYEKDLKELNSIRVQQWKKMQSYSIYLTGSYNNRRQNHPLIGRLSSSTLLGET